MFGLLTTLALLLPQDEAFAVKVGDPAPDFKASWLNHPRTTISELEGRVVLLVFFRTESDEAADVAEEMKKFHEAYAGQGLVVVGVARESERAVKSWMGEHGLEVAAACVSNERVERDYGIDNLPSAVLVDVDGLILWKGLAERFRPEMVHKMPSLLRRAWPNPALPKSRGSTQGALEDGELSKAWSDLNRLRDEDEALAAAADALADYVQAQLRHARNSLFEKEFGIAHATYADLAKRCKGIPGAEDADEARKEIEGDDEAEDELDAWKKRMKAIAKWREGDYRDALDALASLAEKHPGTASSRWASEVLERHR